MSSKAERRKNKRAMRDRVVLIARDAVLEHRPQPRQSTRPTQERLSHGSWIVPKGAMKRSQPMVDMASDVIGVMYLHKMLTHSQEQAARRFQELRSAYISELPDVSGFKSCLAGSVPGYDDGDGDPAVIARYRSVEGKLSLDQRRALLTACDMGRRPQRNETLRAALDIVASVA